MLVVKLSKKKTNVTNKYIADAPIPMFLKNTRVATFSSTICLPPFVACFPFWG